MLKCYRALEIYISGQVNTLNKTFKLLYTSNVFCCGWQTIPNFNNAVSKNVVRGQSEKVRVKELRKKILKTKS